MAFERDPLKPFPHDRLLAATVLRLVPRVVTPNMVTVARFLLIPFVLVAMHVRRWDVALPLFLFTAFTDVLDGSIARTRRQVTRWGTFFDPVADKLLIGSVALLVVSAYVSPWLALAMLGVEALIIAGGISRKHRGVITSANVFGKVKMCLQVAGITLLLVFALTGQIVLVPLAAGVLVLAIVFAIISLLTYGL